MKQPLPFRSDTAELPTDAEVVANRAIYAVAEPRDLAYKVARNLIERSGADDEPFSLGDGVAILLMSWNGNFYRFHQDRLRTLVADLDSLISTFATPLGQWRTRSAASYEPSVDAKGVELIYRAFVRVLWPVGTSKALHVLSPGYFPIWDQAIARAFHLGLSPQETSVSSYLKLMELASRFARTSRLEDPLKALDEWAYVRFTLQR